MIRNSKTQSQRKNVHDEYALAIGKIVLAWNGFQEELARLFASLFGKNAERKALAAWHALENDRAQREMLLAVASQKLGSKSAPYNSIQWLVQETHRRISNNRNFGIHTPIFILSDEKGNSVVTPDIGTGNKRAMSMHNKNLLGEFLAYEAQIIRMTTYACEIRFYLLAPQKRTLPQKPQLQLLQMLAIPKEQRH